MTDGQKLESNTQCRYTPDAGTVEGPVFCGVCGEKMNVKRDVIGPRGYVQAIRGGESIYDSFTCPNMEDDWHRQTVALRNEAKKTASSKLQQLLEEEVEEVLSTRKATKEVNRLWTFS